MINNNNQIFKGVVLSNLADNLNHEHYSDLLTFERDSIGEYVNSCNNIFVILTVLIIMNMEMFGDMEMEAVMLLESMEGIILELMLKYYMIFTMMMIFHHL